VGILIAGGLLLFLVLLIAAAGGGLAKSNGSGEASANFPPRKTQVKHYLPAESAAPRTGNAQREAKSFAQSPPVFEEPADLTPDGSVAEVPSAANVDSSLNHRASPAPSGSQYSAIDRDETYRQRVGAGAPAKKDSTTSPDVSPAEKRRLAGLNKLVRRHFERQRRSPDHSRAQPDDYFVVAKYEMPLATRMADLRFEVSEAVDPSVEQVVDYLSNTPVRVLRDFQVVGCYQSQAEADQALAAVRKRYDQVKEYQAQYLTYLQVQQRFRTISSVRRC